MNLPNLDLHPLQRRALLNAGIATLISLVLGFSVLALVGGGDGGAVAAGSPSATPKPKPKPTCTPSWDVVQSANPGTAPDTLHAITVVTSDAAWAVGASGDVTSSSDVLIERWDGDAWTSEEGPSTGSTINELFAVDADPNDVWAVGRSSDGSTDEPLIMRFDGTAWTQQTPPSGVSGVLTGVAAIAPDDVWAVGYSGDPEVSLDRALALHWDGQSWTPFPLDPRAIGNGASMFSGVAATSSDDVWAVGKIHNQPLIDHFDGKRWTRTTTDVHGTSDAIVATGKDVWAVGAPIQRYDGSSWTQAANIRGGGELVSVAAVSPTDVWAVGTRPAASHTTRALVLRYDGQRWRPVNGPSVPGSDALTGVDALSDGTVLAVGYKDVASGRKTLAVRGTTCAS